MLAVIAVATLHQLDFPLWRAGHPGFCWTPDIHNHTTGTCWLKYQEGWDNNVDLSKSNLKANHRGKYSEEFRSIHKTAPVDTQWVAGVIPNL